MTATTKWVVEMKLSSEAQDLYETKYKAVLSQLNGHWEKCETYDASWAKVQRLWLRVAAVLQTFYFHSQNPKRKDNSVMTSLVIVVHQP